MKTLSVTLPGVRTSELVRRKLEEQAERENLKLSTYIRKLLIDVVKKESKK